MRWFRGRKNKYNAETCKCISGHIHHSRGEARYCTELSYLQKAGEIQEFKTQVRYDLVVNDVKVCAHYVDFEVVNKDGKKEVHEYKGFPSETWRLKFNLFRALYPDVAYNIIYARNKNT